MKVTVFGATGKIGRHVLEQLLVGGHEVTVLVRTPSKLAVDPERLTVVVGELSDVDAVRRVVEGADAVVSALGPSMDPRATGAALTNGTRTILAAMDRAGVRRFVGLATPSIADSRDRPTLVDRLLPVAVGIVLPHGLIELRGMSQAVMESDLDWTLARFTAPTDLPAVRTLRAGFLGHDPVGWRMTRSDIAAFVVGQLTDDRYLRAAPAISN